MRAGKSWVWERLRKRFLRIVSAVVLSVKALTLGIAVRSPAIARPSLGRATAGGLLRESVTVYRIQFRYL